MGNNGADKRTVLFLVLVITVLAGGLGATAVLSKYGREEVRRGYLRAAKAAAASIVTEDAAALSGVPEDAQSPAYARVREKLVELREANPDSRFIYLMAMHDDQVVFLADAEPPESDDYSAPGDTYDEATPGLKRAFFTGEPYLEGPFTDRWGAWVTSLAPVRDRMTGKIICLLGWDWSASTWRVQTGVYHWLGLALTLFMVLVLVVGYSGYRRVERINRMLTEETIERRKAEGELQRLAKLDPLTGLGNRRTFDSTLDLEWRRALRAQTPISILMMDIDKFKAYNDHYGHQAGDEALKRVAECLRHAARRAGDESCRYGGEEFVAILPGADETGASRLAELLRSNVEQEAIVHEFSGVGPFMTASIGVATTIPTSDDTPAAFLARADQALYRAKESGRNRIVVTPYQVDAGPRILGEEPSPA